MEDVKTPAKLGLLATLYLSQGLPFGFFGQALPILMRQEGRSLPDIGKATWLMLPWALKFLWAPLVDRLWVARVGRRRSWILPLQAASITLSASLYWLGGGAPIATLMAALFLTNLISATQDIATDGLAVELLSDGERGYGNSVQVAGYRAGMILGGGVLLAVYDKLGPEVTFLAMALLLVLSSVPIVLHRERPVPAATTAASGFGCSSFGAVAFRPRPGRHAAFRLPKPRPPAARRPGLRLICRSKRATPPGLWAFLDVARRPGMGTWLAVLVVYKGGEALAYGMVKPLFVDRGFTMSDIGWLLGTVGFFAGLVGAVLGGALVSRLGRGRALLVAGALQVIGILGYLAPAAGLGGTLALSAASVLEHLTSGVATVALFTIMMDACGDAAGTDYTLQASVVVIATGVAQAMSGLVAGNVGYPGHFAASAVISALGLIFTWQALRRGRVPPAAVR